MKKIVMDCLNLKCSVILLIEYDGPRENDIEIFCQEIADVMRCPECRESNFLVGWKDSSTGILEGGSS